MHTNNFKRNINKNFEEAIIKSSNTVESCRQWLMCQWSNLRLKYELIDQT